MADDVDESMARRFGALDDIEVPELWERIMVLADTDRVEVAQPRRRRPALAAAAVVLALVGVGLAVWLRDEPAQVDLPPQPPPAAGDDNAVEVTFGATGVSVSPAAVAGWVPFVVGNQTDGFRHVDVRLVRPGTTYEDVRAALAAADEDAFERALAEPVVSLVSGPGDALTVGIPLAAGEYVVGSNELDSRLQPLQNRYEAHELRVGAGSAGQRPPPTVQYRFIGDTIIGPTSAPAGPTTIAIDDGDAAPREMIVVELHDGDNRAVLDGWADSVEQGDLADWSQAPAESVVVLGGTAAGRTLTVDLEPGPVLIEAAEDLRQEHLWGTTWLQID